MYWERWLDRRLAQIIASRGYERPYPPQESALEAGLLQGKNVVITSPTSSGKTLVAEIAIAQNYMKDPTSKFLYLVPLKALASEKYEEFSRAWQQIGMKVAVTTGDYDSKDEWLARYDLIIATNEKADSLLRQRPSWLGAVKVVVVDEVHLMNDESRGPTLEAVLTRLMRVLPSAQIIAMSATIGNAEELAGWLNASLVSSDWRPVPLRIGVMRDGKVVYDDGSEREVCGPKDEPSHYVKCLAEDSLKSGGQFLVFANSRRNAVKLARDLAPVTDRYSGNPELEAIAKAISSSDGTELAKELAVLVEKGIAFHHAGLSPEQRNAVESSFKRGLIKGIVATPTLAAGVNLPARRVIIPSIMRYESGFGMAPISVMEFRQLCGRAGRPQYDKEGEAIAFFDRDPEEFFDVYVRSPPEPIEGHLLQSDEVDFQTLASIASGYEDTLDGVVQFFKLSFSGYKASYDYVEGKVKSSLDYLENEGFVRFD
ncbi:MAG: DEAD/DEAH box helicase, partial [TACK group archaeon]|nr:DEAD/DEAH box helicase [TACK group archaeon]